MSSLASPSKRHFSAHNNRFHALVPAVFVVFYITLLAMAARLFNDPDTAWHLAAGQWLLQQDSFFTSIEPFAHPTQGFGWFNISWLWDIAAGWIDQVAGLPGLAIFGALSYAILCAIVTYSALIRGASLLPSSLMLCLGFAGILVATSVRPHSISLICFTLVLLLCERRRSGAIGWRLLFLALPLIWIVWVNVHGAFLAGFTIIGAAGLEALMKGRYRDMVIWGMLGVLCLAACLLQPLGLAMPEAVLRTMGGLTQAYILEWQPLYQFPHRLAYWVITLLLVVMARRHLTLFDWALIVIWSVASFDAARHLSLFALVTVPALALALSKMAYAPHYHWLRRSHVWFQRRYNRPLATAKATQACWFIGVLLMVLLSIGWWQLQADSLKRLTGDPFSEDLIETLKQHPNAKLWNYYNDGGYLVYHLKGAPAVFIDGRAETAYPAEVVARYTAALDDAALFTALLGDYDVDIVILPNEMREHHEVLKASEQWQLWREETMHRVYQRSNSAERS